MKRSFISNKQPIIDYKRLHISAKICSHEIINEDSFLGDKYVVYIVNIFTHYKEWSVRKRYSHFEDLHKILSEKIKGALDLDFPPKRIFKNSESTISERKEKLETYLNYLFRNVNICLHDEVLEFLEVEKELLALLMKNNTMIESKTSVAVKRYYSMKRNSLDSSQKKARSVDDTYHAGNYYSSFLEFKLQDKSLNSEKSANMMVVEEFLRNLEFKFENKCEIIKTFEGFLKSKKNWPNFKREEISKLFYGETFMNNSHISGNSISSDNSNYSKNYIKGLFYHIGNIEQNILGAESCLEFLCKLIDYEYNPDCEAYIYMLKTSKVEHLHSLKLNEHFRSNKIYIVNFCNRILRAIVHEDKAITSKLKKLVNDEDIINKFVYWYENSQTFS